MQFGSITLAGVPARKYVKQTALFLKLTPQILKSNSLTCEFYYGYKTEHFQLS